ncbi:MAG TPA: aldo/keto reductase [Bryobacteraceae bacterium]|nr:aldo/keto reductase [Bryobacteraceae bacterium]
MATEQLGIAESVKKAVLPTRVLGRTGARVSILAFGCGSRFLAYHEDDKAVGALNHALDLGVTYVDTAYAYGNGISETRVGKVMSTRRKDVFLATKMQEREGEKVKAIIEGSLKRLQTDQLDLIHIHELKGEDDLARIEAKGGILDTLLKLRDQKVTRFIGITCHNDPAVLKTALERHDFDCTQFALNAARVGMKVGHGSPLGSMVINPDTKASFETIALPVAKRKNMGVIGMKVFAADGLIGQANPEKLLYYSLSLPVAAVSVGMPTLQHIEESTRMAREFQPLPPDEMQRMSDRLSSQNKTALDWYLHHHQDQFPNEPSEG